MLRGLEGEEPNEGDLHAREGSDEVPRRVGDVEPVGESSHEDEDEGVEGEHCETRRGR